MVSHTNTENKDRKLTNGFMKTKKDGCLLTTIFFIFYALPSDDDREKYFQWQ